MDAGWKDRYVKVPCVYSVYCLDRCGTDGHGILGDLYRRILYS